MLRAFKSTSYIFEQGCISFLMLMLYVCTIGTSFAQPKPYDDADVQFRLRQAAGAVGASELEISGIKTAIDTEKKRVIKSDDERDLSQETLRRLEKDLERAQAQLQARQAVLKGLQDERSRGLADEAARRKSEEARQQQEAEAQRRRNEDAERKKAEEDRRQLQQQALREQERQQQQRQEPQKPPALASDWTGTYSYGQANGVVFRTKLAVDSNGRFRGRTCEIATFGDRTSPNLYANISGAMNGSTVQWTKTYDGTGGVSHSVYYVGQLSADGRTISGTWSIDPSSRGRFNMRVGISDGNKCAGM